MTHQNPIQYVLHALPWRGRIALERGSKGCWRPGVGLLNKEACPCGGSYWCGATDHALLLISPAVVAVAVFDVVDTVPVVDCDEYCLGEAAHTVCHPVAGKNSSKRLHSSTSLARSIRTTGWISPREGPNHIDDGDEQHPLLPLNFSSRPLRDTQRPCMVTKQNPPFVDTARTYTITSLETSALAERNTPSARPHAPLSSRCQLLPAP